MEIVCAVDTCTAPRRARGWCAVHYARWRRHGDPTVVERIYRDDEARFWSKVDQFDGCWGWTGTVNAFGYATLRIGDRGAALAHRYAYELLVGPIPDGLVIDHLCRVRSCVNPAHLEPVTPQENQRRGLLGVLKTHCRNGHEYTLENTYTRQDGRTECRTCMRARQGGWASSR